MFTIVNDYDNIDRKMFFKLEEGSRTRGSKAALVKGTVLVGHEKVLILTEGDK